MNYLQLDDRGKFAREEKLLAEYFGEGNYIPFYKKHLLQNKIKLTKDDFIAGEIPSLFYAMKKLGVDYKHEDYPEALKEFLHRRMWLSKLGYLKDKVFNEYAIEPMFIKPVDKLKKFTGFVLESVDNWFNTNGAGDGTKVICSEPVKWITEYRIPVINGVIRDYSNYSGDPNVQVDKTVVESMVNAWKAAPKAYLLDVGVLDNGITALIEVNDAFSCGSYTMSKETYGDLLTTRWNELKNS